MVANDPVAPALFDSHCHFDFERFDVERERTWSRCRALGVRQLMLPGTEPAQWARAQRLSQTLEGVYFSAGLHPWWLERPREPLWERQLARWLQQPGCLALGECGLDKLIETPMAEQEALLECQLLIAQQCLRPVILHCVKAHNELIRLLKQTPLECGGVVHAFSGSPQIAETYWELGFHLGIGGTITYERARKTRRAVQALPLEALVLETDAPDMPLAGRQGEPNSPEYLPEVARVLSELRAEPLEQVARQTTHNARQLFGLESASNF